MSEAPERIWLAAADEDGEREFWEMPDEGGTPYVRADTIERLEEELREARELLGYYREQFCEGFCKDLSTDGFYLPEMDLDCAGCRARAFLAKSQ